MACTGASSAQMVALGGGRFLAHHHTAPMPDEGRRLWANVVVLLTAFATASAAHRTAVPVAGAVKEASTSPAEERVRGWPCRHTHSRGFPPSWLVSYATMLLGSRALPASSSGGSARRTHPTALPTTAPRSRRQACYVLLYVLLGHPPTRTGWLAEGDCSCHDRGGWLVDVPACPMVYQSRHCRS